MPHTTPGIILFLTTKRSREEGEQFRERFCAEGADGWVGGNYRTKLRVGALVVEDFANKKIELI